MRLLSLDISTKTGYALLELEKGGGENKPVLLEYGLICADKLPEDLGAYPHGYVRCARRFAKRFIRPLVAKTNPVTIVIEETVPGRETYSQKMIEFLHFAIADELAMWDLTETRLWYVRTGEWRKTVELRMTKEDKKGNLKKNLARAKVQAKELRKKIKQLGSGKANADKVLRLKKELSGLQLGKITRKHLSVRAANRLFDLDLKLKDNDVADAIMLGVATLKGAKPCDGKRPKMK